jgi:hypothetical protein
VSIEHDPQRSKRRGTRRGGRRALCEFLTSEGYEISKSTLDKLSMPSAGGKGPPAEGVWGNRHIYDFDKALRWARKRFRSITSAVVAVFAVLCARFFD